ncbi:Hemolysin, putative [Neisseria gonorrhoeae]|uniref:Hemolysin, putative n=1 Tax=Neisseria gonorrhoeae TaxID=485 RepID=A0A379B179_NEIGO|nr:Hemolysin, putative [Neisseria gonorrhoeae]
MGWMVLAVMKSLTASLPPAGLAWLAAGGMLYSVGIYWFVNDEKSDTGTESGICSYWAAA